jgi:hypothetical protein
VRWAAALPTEPARTNATTGAFTYWLLQDAPGARAWLDQADFSAQTKSKMMRAGSILP